jgi:hypothetical protein
LRKRLGRDWIHRHAEGRGQTGDQLGIDHLELPVRLHGQLADEPTFLGPAEALVGHAEFGSVGDEQEAAIRTEDRRFRIVESLQFLDQAAALGIGRR